ncbi:MAG TPA: phenylalanine--tRNA ligase subunit beta, partial [Sphaerochaeta sp.]|nr:phenylalanine--tRNA ligase subunit beta [Sphaerochaeta sp.]
DTTRFVPLGMTEELSLREMLTKHEKGKEFGHIVSDKSLFPYLHDDKGETLSFPPVINSASIGAVEAGDENIFVELSGPGLDDLLLAASILACDMADMGWEILPVEVSFPHETAYGSKITVPYYFQEKSSATVEEIHKTLGEALSHAEIVTALARMGIDAVCCDDGLISATIPPWRNDFLHAVDLVEEVMIGHGLGNFAPEMPHDFTVGRLTEAEELARTVKTLMVGLGFQEMMYNYLGSRRKYITNMRYPEEKCIFIANPMSENYEVVRPSILPSLMESESASAHSPYPHKIFEVGKIAFRDANDPSGTVTRNALGFLASDRLMGYNDVAAMIATLSYYLRLEYTLAEVVDGRFIEGRAAQILINKKAIGIFGEIHPQVLENWGSAMPTIACEIDLDLLRAYR